MGVILSPFIWLLQVLTTTFRSFPIAITIFTVLINVVLVPMNIKQQKNLAKQARLRPRLEELKEKHGKDRMKYQQAMQELYQKEGVSMLGGGCLPMLMPMIVMLIVFQSLMMLIGGRDGTGEILVETRYLWLGVFDLRQSPEFTSNIAYMLSEFPPRWIFPILATASQFLSMVVSNKIQKKNNPHMAQAGGGMMIMTLTMPLISLFWTFGFPMAFAFYWILSSIVHTAIRSIVNIVYSPEKLMVEETIKLGAQRRKAERNVASQ